MLILTAPSLRDLWVFQHQSISLVHTRLRKFCPFAEHSAVMNSYNALKWEEDYSHSCSSSIRRTVFPSTSLQVQPSLTFFPKQKIQLLARHQISTISSPQWVEVLASVTCCTRRFTAQKTFFFLETLASMTITASLYLEGSQSPRHYL